MTPERTAKFERVIRARQLNLCVVLENVHDPHNLGAVIRSCDAVGINEVYILYTDPNLKPEDLSVKKTTSTGARKWVDVYLFEDAKECFETIKQKYDKIYSTHLATDSVSLYELDLTESIALMFGNERDGLTEEALSYSDGNFIIPMKGMVGSLNISVACAVTLYESLRQRDLKGQYDAHPVSSEAQRSDLMATFLDRHEKRYSGKHFINDENPDRS